MFMSDQKKFIFVNGKIIIDSQPALLPESKGLMYGAGCFETIRSYNSKFLHLELHLERLLRGMHYLDISTNEITEPDRIRNLIVKLLEKNELAGQEAVVRIQVSDSGKRGYEANGETGPNMIIVVNPVQKNGRSYRLKTANNCVIPSSCRPSDLKLSNTLHYIQAYRDARTTGADDALMKTIDGNIAESAIANIFWKKGKAVYTPSPECDILPGIMRRIVMKIISNFSGYDMVEGVFNPVDLHQADHIWITNSVRQIQPVTMWDNHEYSTESSFIKKLQNALKSYTEKNLN